MKRRRFIKSAVHAGMLCHFPLLPYKSWADVAPPDSFLICITARGGWDPRVVLDPKGGRGYGAGDHFTAGNLRVGPGSATTRAFFEKYQKCNF